MDRKYDAKLDLLKSPEFKTMAKSVIAAFGIENVALVGGLAVAHYAKNQVTLDADFLIVGTCADVSEGAEWFNHPWSISAPMRFKDSIPDHCIRVRRESPKMIIDLLSTGRIKYLRSIVEHAVEIEVQPGLHVPIALVEDVIVMKTIARRGKDLADIEALGVKLGKKIDQQYIRKTLASGFKGVI